MTERMRTRPSGHGHADFRFLIPACVMLVLVAGCASSPNTATTPPTTMPLTTTAAAPTTTVPVTTTVVDAEQPDASAAAAEATVTVTFSGDACTYTGASTFDVGTELTIEVVNGTERSFGFSVWKLPDGTTVADIEAQGMLEVGGDMSENMRGILRPGSVESRDLLVVLDESGTWGMNCFTLLTGTIQPGEDYPVVVVEVR